MVGFNIKTKVVYFKNSSNRNEWNNSYEKIDIDVKKLFKENLYLHEDTTKCKFIKKNDNLFDISFDRGIFFNYINKSITHAGLKTSYQTIKFGQNNQNRQDIVIFFRVLECIVNLDSFIKLFLDILKKNIFIVTASNNCFFIRCALNNILNLPPHHLLHWNEYVLEYIAKKYNLEIVDIYKEKVTNVHKDWFYTTKFSKFIRGLFCISTKTINVSFLNRVIQKISFILSKFARHSCSYLKEDGHTIAMVFRKIHDA